MIYSKKTRRRPTRPALRNNILSGMHLHRRFTSGLLLLAIVLITAMGMLFTSHSKTDITDCHCVALDERQLEMSSTLHENAVKFLSRKAIGNIDKDPPLRSLGVNTDKQFPSILPDVSSIQSAVSKHSKEPNVVPNKFKSEWWRNHTRTVCKALGLSTNQSSLQPAMLSKVLVDDNHKILYCQIAKVASTNLGKIFAIIAGKFNGTNPEDISSTDIHWKYNKLHAHLDSFPIEGIIDKLKHYFKFVFVRDPLERLVSGYRNKFLKPSSSYFSYLNKKLVRVYRTNASITGGVTFAEFVTYLVDKDRKIPMNGHWQPMYELCRPCETNYDFVGKITSFGEDVTHILQTNNLAGIMEVPMQSSSHSFHKTDLYLKEFYSQVPKPLLLNLYQKYYPDYAIFDSEVPEVIRTLLK